MYNNLYETLCEMLERFDHKGEIANKSDLETIRLVTDSIKNLEKIEMLKGEDGDSFGDNSYDGGMSSRTYVRGYYRGGNRGGRGRGRSYADGGSYNDSYGSYDGGRGGYRGGYDSYAETVEQLKKLMHNANEHEKQVLQHAVMQIEQNQ